MGISRASSSPIRRVSYSVSLLEHPSLNINECMMIPLLRVTNTMPIPEDLFVLSPGVLVGPQNAPSKYISTHLY